MLNRLVERHCRSQQNILNLWQDNFLDNFGSSTRIDTLLDVFISNNTEHLTSVHNKVEKKTNLFGVDRLWKLLF